MIKGKRRRSPALGLSEPVAAKQARFDGKEPDARSSAPRKSWLGETFRLVDSRAPDALGTVTGQAWHAFSAWFSAAVSMLAENTTFAEPEPGSQLSHFQDFLVDLWGRDSGAWQDFLVPHVAVALANYYLCSEPVMAALATWISGLARDKKQADPRIWSALRVVLTPDERAGVALTGMRHAVSVRKPDEPLPPQPVLLTRGELQGHWSGADDQPFVSLMMAMTLDSPGDFVLDSVRLLAPDRPVGRLLLWSRRTSDALLPEDFGGLSGAAAWATHSAAETPDQKPQLLPAERLGSCVVQGSAAQMLERLRAEYFGSWVPHTDRLVWLLGGGDDDVQGAGVCVAGGALVHACQADWIDGWAPLDADSDCDLWIYGPTQKYRSLVLARLVLRFPEGTKFSGQLLDSAALAYCQDDGDVANTACFRSAWKATVPGAKRCVQIISTSDTRPATVTGNFDLVHLDAFYAPELGNVSVSSACLSAWRTRCTSATEGQPHGVLPARWARSQRRAFQVPLAHRSEGKVDADGDAEMKQQQQQPRVEQKAPGGTHIVLDKAQLHRAIAEFRVPEKSSRLFRELYRCGQQGPTPVITCDLVGLATSPSPLAFERFFRAIDWAHTGFLWQREALQPGLLVTLDEWMPFLAERVTNKLVSSTALVAVLSSDVAEGSEPVDCGRCLMERGAPAILERALRRQPQTSHLYCCRAQRLPGLGDSKTEREAATHVLQMRFDQPTAVVLDSSTGRRLAQLPQTGRLKGTVLLQFTLRARRFTTTVHAQDVVVQGLPAPEFPFARNCDDIVM